MINLLSPQTKEQIAYSRRNVVLGRYLIFVFIMGAALAAILFVAHSYADHQLTESRAQLTEREADVATFDRLQEEADEISAKFTAIDALLDSQARFSALLGDLAEMLPSGTYINGLSLTGDNKQPVSLTITVNSYTQASIVRNSLVASERIESADIQSVTQGGDKLVAEFVIAFNEEAGQ